MREKRGIALFILVCVCFGFLCIRLSFLQLFNIKKYRKLAKQNYAKPEIIEAPRGRIYDRKGIILVDNIPTYTIIIDSNSVTKEEYDSLNAILSLSSYIKKKVSFEKICKIEEKIEKFPHIEIKMQPIRRYLYNEIFFHPIGFASEISKEERKNYPHYSLGTTIGKDGIEKKYDMFLKGKDGVRYIETNAKGEKLRLLSSISPEPGCDIYLNIDADLQVLAYNLLPRKGACIAMNPKGEVIIWVSKPGFDPNIFSQGISSAQWEEILKDTLYPLIDRGISEYPPASIFKLVPVACGIEKEIVKEKDYQSLGCHGSMIIGNRSFGCWEKHGSLNLIDAIAQSCDVYFYQLGMQIGIKDLCENSKMLNFGKLTGIDLPEEKKGLIPTEEFYDKVYGKRKWGKGIIANLSIGQGEILTTPIQILCFITAIANNGIGVKPRIVSKVVKNGEVIFSEEPEFYTLPLKKTTIEILKKGMLDVVNAEKGTGRACYIPGIKVAGKTGTAQVPKGECHAWFVCFAPYENPEIVLVVFVENGGMGGSVAAPIAAKILKKFFNIFTET